MEAPFLRLDIDGLVQYLKTNFHGPGALQALRLRAAIHFLDPKLDPLSERMLEAYGVFRDMIGNELVSVLDAGCMSGYLRHFLLQKCPHIGYVGIDSWDEALEVGREFQPGIDLRKCDLLKDKIPDRVVSWQKEPGFDYVWLSNIVFEDNQKVVDKLLPLARKALVIAQPPWCGEWPGEKIPCGKTTIYINKNDLNLHRA